MSAYFFSLSQNRTKTSSTPGPAAAQDSSPEDLQFESVYDVNFEFVWCAVRRLGVPPSAVDDAVQDVFIVVHRRLSEFRGQAALRTWLYQITLRVVAHYRRTGIRKRAFVDDGVAPDALPDGKQDPHDSMAKFQDVELLYRLLDELDDDRRTVFVLAEIEQLAAPQIAEVLGVKINTVYSRLRSARQIVDKAAPRLLRAHLRGAT